MLRLVIPSCLSRGTEVLSFKSFLGVSGRLQNMACLESRRWAPPQQSSRRQNRHSCCTPRCIHIWQRQQHCSTCFGITGTAVGHALPDLDGLGGTAQGSHTRCVWVSQGGSMVLLTVHAQSDVSLQCCRLWAILVDLCVCRGDLNRCPPITCIFYAEVSCHLISQHLDLHQTHGTVTASHVNSRQGAIDQLQCKLAPQM